MSKLRRLDIRHLAIQGALKIAGQNIVVRAIGLVGNLVIARILAPRQFGVLALGLTITTILGVAGSVGLGAALVRGSREPTRADLGFMEGLQLLVALAAMVALCAATPVFGATAAVAAVMTSAMAIDAFQVPNSILLERTLAYGPVALVGVLTAASQTLVSVTLVVAGFGVFGVAVASPLSALVGTIALLRWGPHRLIRPNLGFRAASHLLREGTWFALQDLVSLIRDQGLNVVIAALGGLATLGAWALATRLLLVPYVLLSSLWQVSFPAMARLRDQGDESDTAMKRALTLTAMGLGVTLALLGGPTAMLVTVLFGSRWRAADVAIPLCCLSYMIVGPISVAGGGRLFALGKVRTVVMSSVGNALVLLIVSAALLSRLRLAAVGIGYVGSAAVEAAVFAVALDFSGRTWIASQGAATVACVLAALAGRLVSSTVPNDLVGLMAAESVVAVTYLCVLLLTDAAGLRRAMYLLRSGVLPRRIDRRPVDTG